MVARSLCTIGFAQGRTFVPCAGDGTTHECTRRPNVHPRSMHRDIESRQDIDILMLRFYERAMSDPLIGPIFTEGGAARSR